MKLKDLFNESQQIKPWKFTAEELVMDNKGKVSYIHPELRGPAQCPFWKTLKTKIAANLKEAQDDVKVPKSFAIEVGKEYKVPLDPTYTTPVCIGAKICAHFRGVSKGAISCDFKLGVKAGPKKQVDVASTAEPVPAANKEEAPVKEANVPSIPINEKEDDIVCGKCKGKAYKTGEDVKCKKCDKTEDHCDCPPVSVYKPFPRNHPGNPHADKRTNEEVGAERGSVPAVSETEDIDWKYVDELIAKGEHQELGSYLNNFAQYGDKDIRRMLLQRGHGESDVEETFRNMNERNLQTSATPTVGLTDGRPGNYPEDTMTESQYSRYASTDEQEQLINELENTLKQLGKKIVGGITIGKSPQTVVLDLKYQGSEIYINASDEERGRDANVKINGVVVDPTDIEAVKSAVEGI